MNKRKTLNKQRQRRTYRVRNKLRGTAERPRLCVVRSHKHLYCQLIDDTIGKTIASASTREKSLQGQLKYGGNKDAAAMIGKTIAERALTSGIKCARIDRGQNKYHGRVAALADAAREAGLVV